MLPALLVRHQVVEADALLPGQLFHHELFQLLILCGAVLLDEVGQLVGGGFQHRRLLHILCAVPAGVYVQIYGAVPVKAIGTLVPALLVGLALIEHHIHTCGLRKGPHGLHSGPLPPVQCLSVHGCIGCAPHSSPSKTHSWLFLSCRSPCPAGVDLLLCSLCLPLLRLFSLLVCQLQLHRVEIVHRL